MHYFYSIYIQYLLRLTFKENNLFENPAVLSTTICYCSQLNYCLTLTLTLCP